MKNKKILASLVLVLFAITMVAGCGGTKTPAEVPGEKPESVKIGLNAELSGNVAQYGIAVANAIELGFEEINAAGGADGIMLEVIKYDNRSENAESLNIATRLASQDEVSVIVGPVTSSNAIATVPVSEQFEIPVVSPTGTALDITVDPKTGETRPFMFRTCFIDPFQGQVAAQYAAENLGFTKASIYVDNNSDYSKGLEASFQEAFEGFGGEIVSVEGFVIEDRDFRSTLTKIIGTNPEVIFIPAYEEQVSLIISQARELGYTGVLLGTDGWDGPKLPEVNTAEALQNVFFTNHYSPESTDPKVIDFVKNYTEKFGSAPTSLAALGYDAAYVIADAVAKAGSADPVAIKDAIAATSGLVGVTGSMTLDAQHNPIKSAVIIGFNEEGKQIYVETIDPK